MLRKFPKAIYLTPFVIIPKKKKKTFCNKLIEHHYVLKTTAGSDGITIRPTIIQQNRIFFFPLKDSVNQKHTN